MEETEVQFSLIQIYWYNRNIFDLTEEKSPVKISLNIANHQRRETVIFISINGDDSFIQVAEDPFHPYLLY